MNEKPKHWSSQLEYIKLYRPLKVRITENATGVIIRAPEFSLVGDGRNFPRALEMLIEKLILDYYEFGLNPGPQSSEDTSYGRRVARLFSIHGETEERVVAGHLLTFHHER